MSPILGRKGMSGGQVDGAGGWLLPRRAEFSDRLPSGGGLSLLVPVSVRPALPWGRGGDLDLGCKYQVSPVCPGGLRGSGERWAGWGTGALSPWCPCSPLPCMGPTLCTRAQQYLLQSCFLHTFEVGGGLPQAKPPAWRRAQGPVPLWPEQAPALRRPLLPGGRRAPACPRAPFLDPLLPGLGSMNSIEMNIPGGLLFLAGIFFLNKLFHLWELKFSIGVYVADSQCSVNFRCAAK